MLRLPQAIPKPWGLPFFVAHGWFPHTFVSEVPVRYSTKRSCFHIFILALSLSPLLQSGRIPLEIGLSPPLYSGNGPSLKEMRPRGEGSHPFPEEPFRGLFLSPTVKIISDRHGQHGDFPPFFFFEPRSFSPSISGFITRFGCNVWHHGGVHFQSLQPPKNRSGYLGSGKLCWLDGMAVC